MEMDQPMLQRMQSVTDEFGELDLEFGKLQQLHLDYLQKIAEMKVLQTKCVSIIGTQRYRMKRISETIHDDLIADDVGGSDAKGSDDSERQNLLDKISERKQQFRSMEEFLPHKNGLYLSIILGHVNISLLSRIDRLNYKHAYEKFKLILNIIIFSLSILLYCLPIHSRNLDAAFSFLLVWYYCTLTIREHILINNGSKIKGWWLTHHFISTAAAGVFLTWPDGKAYWMYRNEFLIFEAYISIVQLAQFYYQTGVLYRLRSLGIKNDMDITLDGFTSWMFKGFTFLLPFLFLGYGFQIYLAYILFILSRSNICEEWQVPALSAIFLLIAFGNVSTTLIVVKRRYATKFKDYFLTNRYRLERTKTKHL